MFTRYNRLSNTDKKYIFGIIAFGVLGLFTTSLFYVPITTACTNYNDIQSGSNIENCTIFDYKIKTSIVGNKNIICSFYAIAECSRAQLEVDVNCTQITCNDISILNKCMSVRQIGDNIQYYNFNKHPNNYYNVTQYQKFIQTYSNKPITSIIIVSVFCAVFLIIAIGGVIMYILKFNAS